jgi:hypothetical protein
MTLYILNDSFKVLPAFAWVPFSFYNPPSPPLKLGRESFHSLIRISNGIFLFPLRIRGDGERLWVRPKIRSIKNTG